MARRFSRDSGDNARICAFRIGCPLAASKTWPRMIAVPVCAEVSRGGWPNPGDSDAGVWATLTAEKRIAATDAMTTRDIVTSGESRSAAQILISSIFRINGFAHGFVPA